MKFTSMSSSIATSIIFVVFISIVGVVRGQNENTNTDNDCSSLESEVISDVIALGKDSKNRLFDTIERLESRNQGARECTTSEWRINFGHLSYYKIGDGTPDGVGCQELPSTRIVWPYDTNDKGVDHVTYPAATVREGMCGSGLVLEYCTPEPIKDRYSYDRPTNTCPRVYCVTDADPLVAGEYWEDISNFVQDQVPRYIKGAIDTRPYEECRIPPTTAPVPAPTPRTDTPTWPDPEDGAQNPATPTPNTNCGAGGRDEDLVTKLDFFEATLLENTLHNKDQKGRLRYEGVGIFQGDPIDLVVTQNPDSPPYSTDMSIRNGYNRGEDPENPDTRWERFGNINVMTKDPRDATTSDEDKALMNGEATFDFCFYYTGTEEKATVDSFDWSVYDTDYRGGGLNEKFTIDTSQAEFYRVQEDMEVKMWCENKGPETAMKDGTFTYNDWEGTPRTVDRYKPVTCDPGVNTIFHSTTLGKVEDNPTDPTQLTKQQLSRSIEFRFENTSCWTFKYEHYCPCGENNYCNEEGGGDPDLCFGKNKWCPQSTNDHKNYDRNYPNACKSYSGGNFLFAGTADEKITEGECVTPPPTTAPDPTESPTRSPIDEATTEPPVEDRPPPPRGDCFDDVTVMKMYGDTEFPLSPIKPVTIVDVDEEANTVTVALHQSWTATSSSTVGHIFASYKESTFHQVCVEEQDLIGGGTVFDTITIQCNVMSPRAHLTICVADDLIKNVLTADDDAEIPKCCHPNLPPDQGTVCYALEINCDSECIEASQEDRRRRSLLRAGN